MKGDQNQMREIKSYSRTKCERHNIDNLSTVWCINVCQFYKDGACLYER